MLDFQSLARMPTLIYKETTPERCNTIPTNQSIDHHIDTSDIYDSIHIPLHLRKYLNA